MTEPRRPRAATQEKQARVLDATEEIMLEEGYAAVSSRSVAARAGINPPLVHYYFGTLDDLFVALLRRGAERTVTRMAAALASERPLRAWWDLASDPRGATLFIELIAAGNHRPALAQALGTYAHDVRKMQTEALDELLGDYDLDAEEFPPAMIAAAVQGVAFAIVADENAAHDTATDEARQGVERLIERLEARRSG